MSGGKAAGSSTLSLIQLEETWLRYLDGATVLERRAFDQCERAMQAGLVVYQQVPFPFQKCVIFSLLAGSRDLYKTRS